MIFVGVSCPSQPLPMAECLSTLGRHPRGHGGKRVGSEDMTDGDLKPSSDSYQPCIWHTCLATLGLSHCVSGNKGSET